MAASQHLPTPSGIWPAGHSSSPAKRFICCWLWLAWRSWWSRAYLGTRYALFGFGLATGDADLIRSFQHSGVLTAGRKSSLLAILLSLLVLNVLGASLLGLGLFITLPLSVLMSTSVYRQLTAR
jgi:hypothetical protein